MLWKTEKPAISIISWNAPFQPARALCYNGSPGRKRRLDMKNLGRLKTFWNVLFGLFALMAFFNFMMPHSSTDENIMYRLFYLGLAVLFAVASLSLRAVIKALEEIKDKNIE